MTDDQLVARALRGSSNATRISGGQVLGLYRRLHAAGQLGRYLVVEYRCAHASACVLARVFTIPAGTFIHKPAYRWSPVAPTRGPAGSRYRPETAYLLPVFPIAVNLECDHVQACCDADAVSADIALAHHRGTPTGRRLAGSPTAPARRT
ncbi:hypothetical protein [Pseudonocardia sp. GCM10023141]|uniref:hypothetical protein n=1 Tax=Pseudonocardia sp. GCM10023141 TaxID=3252653 RepID=UPI00360B8A4D